MIKIGLAMANNNTCVAEQCYKKRDGYSFIKTVSADIANNRNLCIAYNKNVPNKILSEKYQDQFDFDYFLSLDSDIKWTFNDVRQLVKHDLPIVSGAYERKDNKNVLHAGWWKKPGVIGKDMIAKDAGLQPIDWCGGGFLLIKKEVFEKMACPWFHSRIIEYYKDGVLCAESTSADIGFCLVLQEHGYKLHIDTCCKVQHI